MDRLDCKIIAILLLAGPIFAFDPVHHLGGNSPYFTPGRIFDISSEAPDGCYVDQVAFVSRHGSRFPDPGAYQQWQNLSQKIHGTPFTTDAPELQFLQSWQPVLSHPDQQISQISLGGYRELYDMGVQYRQQYPDLYTDNSPFVLWANRYQNVISRVTDSARLFARGYLGPNATSVGRVLVINQTDPRSLANSLAPSDLCPNFVDDSGGNFSTTWANIYLPPITRRINARLRGLAFSSADVSIFPYLCGFETQITGKRSPWCSVLSETEIAQYEYAQDLRYYYGGGIGTDLGKGMMLPVLTKIVQRLVDGPDVDYISANETQAFKPNPLMAMFTNDGQINQLVASIGVFDEQRALSATSMEEGRLFRSSKFVPMRGTVSFERLNCSHRGVFIRLKLDDEVYPVATCQNGPGRSCGLEEYQELVEKKSTAFGGFAQRCGLGNVIVESTSFLETDGLPYTYVVSP